MTWATTTLIVLFLLATAAGSLLGGALGFLGNSLSAVGEAAKVVAPQLASAAQGPLGDLRQEIDSAMQAGTPAERARTAAATIRVITKTDASQAEQDEAASGVAQSAGISPEDARGRLNQWRQTYQSNAAEIERKARVAAEATARQVSRGAFAAFIALLLGGAAGAFGGRVGAPRDRDETVLTTSR